MAPPGVVSGTTAYAKWWKANNRERYLAYRARRRAKRREAAGFVDRQAIADARAVAIRAELDAGLTRAQTAKKLGLNSDAVKAVMARKGWIAFDTRKLITEAPATVKRRFAEALATPKWLDPASLFAIYLECRLRRQKGEDVVVDHVVPINGKDVCGLHVPWNLQIIPAISNSVKGNRHTVMADVL